MHSHRASLAAAAIAAASALLPATASAEIHDWQADPEQAFRMWIDDDQEVVYGFLVIFNESAGDTRDLAERALIQAWVRTFGFGIIGMRTPSDVGYHATVLDAMEAFAELSGHPEIAHAPVITEGISLGGHNAIVFAAEFPERTIGYLGGAAGRLPEDTSDPQFRRTPGLFYHGEDDPSIDAATTRRDQFIALREDGVQVAFFIQWEAGHERLYADEIGWKFLSDVVRLRYPDGASPLEGPVELLDIPDETGWLADHTSWEGDATRIARFGDFAGDVAGSTFWLPTRDAAFAYRAHSSRDRPVSFLAPSGEVDWVLAEPGESVPIEVSIGGLSDVAEVEVFDGSRSIASLTGPPYQTTWTAEGVGAHSLVAVATLEDGSIRTGYVAPVLVTGTGLPGGGGLDEGGSDGGPGGEGDGDDDGDDGPGAGAPGDDGGCGCRTGAGGGGRGAATVLLVAAALLWSRRR